MTVRLPAPGPIAEAGLILRVQVGSGVHEAGAELAANAHRFVSRLAADRYLGYLSGQKAAMTGRAGAHTLSQPP